MMTSMSKVISNQQKIIVALTEKIESLSRSQHATTQIDGKVNTSLGVGNPSSNVDQFISKVSYMDVCLSTNQKLLDRAVIDVHKLKEQHSSNDQSIAELACVLKNMKKDFRSIFRLRDESGGFDIDEYMEKKTNQAHALMCQKIDELFNRISSIEIMVKSCIQRDEFKVSVSNKVTVDELQDFVDKSNQYVTHHQLQDNFNSQIKPLARAVASLERAIQIQLKSNGNNSDQINSSNEFSMSINRRSTNSNSKTDNKELVFLINDVINERHLGDVTKLGLQTSLADLHQQIFREIATSNEIVRLDVVTSIRSEQQQDIECLENKIVQLQMLLEQKLSDMQESTMKVMKKAFNKFRSNLDKERISRDKKVCSSTHESAIDMVKLQNFFGGILNERIDHLNAAISREIELVQSKLQDTIDAVSMIKKTNCNGDADLRMGVGEIVRSIRAEVQSKVDRKEMQSMFIETLDRDINNLADRIFALEEHGDQREQRREQIDQPLVVALEKQLDACVRKEMMDIEGRYLWTNQSFDADSFVKWDLQSKSGEPVLLWTHNDQAYVHIKTRGLYKVSIAFFVHASSVLAFQLYLNGEPVVSIQQPPSSTGSGAKYPLDGGIRFSKKHLQHSMGNVVSSSIEEYLLLPVDSCLSVRCLVESATPMQAFLMVKKL